jgi:hypothetical protein
MSSINIIWEGLGRKLKSRKPSSQSQGNQSQGASDQLHRSRFSQEISQNLTLDTFGIEVLADTVVHEPVLDQRSGLIVPKHPVAGGSQFQQIHSPDTREHVPSSLATFSRESRSTGSLGQYVNEHEREIEGRRGGLDTINYSLVALWIEYCEQHHGAESSRREAQLDSSVEMDIILIDTRCKCLVRGSTASRYLALSYVWGAISQLQNTTALCESLMDLNSLLAHKDTIPQVITDAMEVTYSLGENYLWVDSLCIVQDDAAAKHHQISHMANIYSSAALTLVAVGAHDANSNLPGVRPGTRWPQSWRQQQNELSRPLRPDLVLKAIDRSLYVSRAWTFQERHLSRRCLYFLDEQIYFQCRKELWCEEPPLLLQPAFSLASPPDIGLSIMSRAPEWAKNIKRGDWDRAFGFYAEIIQEYSWKNLTFPEDIMSAFSGIATALETHSGWDITHGLLEQLIDWALLWTPVGAQRRRPPPHSGPLLQFPSWSWIGWIGPVTFNFAFESTLASLCSLLEDVEVEEFGEGTATFRKARRIVLEKRFLQENSDNGRFDRVFTFKTANPPNPNRDYSLLLGSTLRFSAQTISASVFEVKEMPPWLWNSATYSDKRAKGIQSGVLVFSNKRLAGCFYGIDVKFLQHYQWSRLRLVAISRGNKYKFGEGKSMVASAYQRDQENGLWTSFKHWDWEFSVCNFDSTSLYVMLVQKRGPYSERVAVGQVDASAWSEANPVNDTILLV